jgi:SAM-dependent methyltransferase
MDSLTQKILAEYESVQYPGNAFTQTHPDLIAVVAARAGMAAPPVENCRVLEIGCATGGNLLPMAEQMPQSKFVGIDLSPAQIRYGQSIVGELGLTNIELCCQDLMELPEDDGRFDYIIAHGVYSWVPAEVRERLLEVCQRHLAPNGLAYISFTTFPGSVHNQIARELAMFHSRGVADEEQLVNGGRGILRFMLQNAVASPAYRKMLHEAHEKMTHAAWQYVCHDDLAAVCQPFYFWEFMAKASRAGLEYLGDTESKGMWAGSDDPLRRKVMEVSNDMVECEQYMDFLVNRVFRASVLCRQGAVPSVAQGDGKFRQALFASGNPTERPSAGDPGGVRSVEFSGIIGKVELREAPPIAAVRHLKKAWPRSVPFAELVDIALGQSPTFLRRAQVADALWKVLDLCFALGLIDFSTRPRRLIADAPTPLPKATAYARWQAAGGQLVVNLRHVGLPLDDDVRRLLPLCDGSRDHPALAAALQQENSADSPASGGRTARRSVDELLNLLVSLHLLLKN